MLSLVDTQSVLGEFGQGSRGYKTKPPILTTFTDHNDMFEVLSLSNSSHFFVVFLIQSPNKFLIMSKIVIS